MQTSLISRYITSHEPQIVTESQVVHKNRTQHLLLSTPPSQTPTLPFKALLWCYKVKDYSFHPVALMWERTVLFSYAGRVCTEPWEWRIVLWMDECHPYLLIIKPEFVLAVIMLAPGCNCLHWGDNKVTSVAVHTGEPVPLMTHWILFRTQSVSKCATLCTVQCVSECFFPPSLESSKLLDSTLLQNKEQMKQGGLEMGCKMRPRDIHSCSVVTGKCINT